MNLRRIPVALVTIAVLLPGAGRAFAQVNPVKWAAAAKPTLVRPGGSLSVVVEATVTDGWHLYSITQPPPPIATRISLPAGQPFTLSGTITAPVHQTAFDDSFGIDTEFYTGSPSFGLPVKAAPDAPAGRAALRVQAYYQACNNQFCLPPKTVTMEVPVTVEGGGGVSSSGAAASPAAPEGAAAPASPSAASSPRASPPVATAPAVSPAVEVGSARASSVPLPAAVLPTVPARGTLWSFVWLAMSVGALSLLTPCVFPMVPITVSYFTKHAAGSRGKAVQQAVTYVVGIILTFTALGMAMALLVGATSLNRFAANPWVNILISTIFIAFALSLFGVFDLGLPPSVLNRLDALTRRKGGSQTVATLLMGLTFTLTSFTCTAPFIGTLLVMAAGGDWQWPLVGMLAFSSVFALPFFVLALMPQWMASLPRSGGWLDSVKVLMAFLEVAAAMKFVSNVDLIWGWGIFSHDVVLATWVVLFVMMALYVLGLFRFAHDAPVQHVGIARLATSLVCGTIGLWLMTGLVGKPLGELEAFLPPPAESMKAGVSAADASSEQPWIMNDYEQALATAGREGKRVFVDFTGYTCTNCRWMEANMFPRPDVRRELDRFVRVRLYTDGAGDIYQKQQRLQQEKYLTVALPFYAVVEPDGSPVASFPGLTRDPAQFVAFLKGAQGS